MLSGLATPPSDVPISVNAIVASYAMPSASAPELAEYPATEPHTCVPWPFSSTSFCHARTSANFSAPLK